MGRSEDFWAVTESALRFAIRRLGREASDVQRRRLMDAYLTLRCFPEVPEAMARLAGRPRAILSNGAWDAAGAKAFGFQVAWCNRPGAPEEELGLSADVIVRGLDELPR
jgi:FMN phosphatase YigB (HAD superfamily)